MSDDLDHLRDYAATGAEDSFAIVVRLYLPLVYGAAVRRVGGDVHCAQDVSQLVFTALAKNARPLARHPDLAGWLFTTTRFIAAKTLRGERRRVIREQAAGVTADTMSPGLSPGEPDALHAVVDDLLSELRQDDRQVILLRFHRGLRLGAIGARLGKSENAVQKRLDRALDQLRDKLKRRGITSTATAVAAMLEQQAAIALPSGLAAAALAAGLAGSATTGGLLAGSGLVAVSKLQTVLAATAAVALGGALAWQTRENHALRQATATQSEVASRRVVGLQQELDALKQRTAAVEADAVKLDQALRAARSPAPQPPTRTLTDDRTRRDVAQKRGQQFIREGKLQEALDTYLECYRELSRDRGTVERQILMSSIKRLGDTYPPAIAALHALRDAALQRVVTNSDDKAISEVAVLNERLGDSRSSMALHDSLPIGHPGRQSLALIAQNAFVEARRYQDALVGESFGSMLTNFEREVTLAQREADRPGGEMFRQSVVKNTLCDIEILTGAGKLADARKLTEKLLAFDNSEATHTAVKRHVARASQSRHP